MNCPENQYIFFDPPHPGGCGLGIKISKVREISRTAEKTDKKNSAG